MEAFVWACSRQIVFGIHRDVGRVCISRLRSTRQFSIHHCLHETKKDKLNKNDVKDKSKSKDLKVKEKSSAEAEPVSAISAKIIEQILSMKVSGGVDAASDTDSKLDLAKPIDRRAKRLEAKKSVEEIQKEAPGVDLDLIKATREVAAKIGGDVEKTKSELLTKLLQHKKEAKPQSGSEVGDILAGMKIDRVEKSNARGARGGSHVGELQKEDGRQDITSQIPSRFVSKTDLFGAPRLNIFSKEPLIVPETGPVLKTWEMLHQRELDLLVTHPPKNAYDEEIQWLKQGKVWRFPIDNEQGMDEEKMTGFHEHVFLEPLIADFPKKGPIRHFMELVLVGLSKNPYITVQQKKADIEWFRQYFKDKEAVLKEVGAWDSGFTQVNEKSKAI